MTNETISYVTFTSIIDKKRLAQIGALQKMKDYFNSLSYEKKLSFAKEFPELVITH